MKSISTSTLAPADPDAHMQGGQAPLRIVTVTTFFPNAADHHRSVFLHNLVEALRADCDVQVISPIPYVPPFTRRAHWQRMRAIPAAETIGSVHVTHPRFAVLPGVEALSAVSYMFGVLLQVKAAATSTSRVLIHAHCAYPDGVGVALACSILRLPFVVTAHGSDLNVYAQRRGLRFQIQWALRRAAGVIVVSTRLREKALEMLSGAEANTACIPCAAHDPGVFARRPKSSARSALELPTAGRIVLFVGQLVSIKGLDILVAAWAQLRREGKLGVHDRLVLVGHGPLRASLEAQIQRENLIGSILFAGPLKQDRVALWMNAADTLCLPSHNEGTPNVVVEALASGLPVVASRVGGIPDLVAEGVNGYLVPPSDSVALARALDRALSYQWDAQLVAGTVTHRTWKAIAAQNHAFMNALI